MADGAFPVSTPSTLASATSSAVSLVLGLTGLAAGIQLPASIGAQLLLAAFAQLEGSIDRKALTRSIGEAFRAALTEPLVAPCPHRLARDMGVTIRRVDPQRLAVGEACAWQANGRGLVLQLSAEVSPEFARLYAAYAVGVAALVHLGVSPTRAASKAMFYVAESIGAHAVVPRELVEQVVGEIPAYVDDAQFEVFYQALKPRVHAMCDHVGLVLNETLDIHFGHIDWFVVPVGGEGDAAESVAA